MLTSAMEPSLSSPSTCCFCFLFNKLSHFFWMMSFGVTVVVCLCAASSPANRLKPGLLWSPLLQVSVLGFGISKQALTCRRTGAGTPRCFRE